MYVCAYVYVCVYMYIFSLLWLGIITWKSIKYGFWWWVEKDGGASVVEVQKDRSSTGQKPLKEKTTKAERRALQEAQRAAKAAAKGAYHWINFLRLCLTDFLDAIISIHN